MRKRVFYLCIKYFMARAIGPLIGHSPFSNLIIVLILGPLFCPIDKADFKPSIVRFKFLRMVLNSFGVMWVICEPWVWLSLWVSDLTRQHPRRVLSDEINYMGYVSAAVVITINAQHK